MYHLYPFSARRLFRNLQQPQLFRQHLARWHELHPELFPPDFHDGYRLKDIRHSKKRNVSYRRIRLKNNMLCPIFPSFAMPYMAAFTDEVSTILFLHTRLKIRERGKHLKEQFFDIGKRVWKVYRCENKEDMRRWSKRNLTGVVLEKVLDLCSKKRQWTKHLEHRRWYRTSNMLARLMRLQNKFFEQGQSFDGNVPSTQLRCRSWVLLLNYWHWCPRTRKLDDGDKNPGDVGVILNN